MNNTSLTDALTRLLPLKLQPYAKAVYPFVTTILAVVVTAIITKEPIDAPTLSVAITGLVSTLLTFLAPNVPYIQPGPGAIDPETPDDAMVGLGERDGF